MLAAGCGKEDCLSELAAQARPADGTNLHWPEVGHSIYLHLTSRDLAWDISTPVIHDALSRDECPEVAPPVILPERNGSFVGLAEVLNERPPLRVAGDVRFRRVQDLFERMRDAGMGHVELTRVHCATQRSCQAQGIEAGIVGWGHTNNRPTSAERERRNPFGSLVFSEPVPPSQLRLEVIELREGWRIQTAGGVLAAGCETTTSELQTVSKREGFTEVVACVTKVKHEFPAEDVVRLVPLETTQWSDIAEQITALRPQFSRIRF
ncbi:MAG: hypothetical protein AAGE52_34530 [Myxococcota bacterium]